MSMLSEQCAKLRKLAGEISALQRQKSDWLWKDSAKLVDAVNALREAADTIEGLRDRLQADAMGSRTCENEDGWCSECRHFLHDGFSWCPWCGAKVTGSRDEWKETKR